ncbi:ATP-binding protein [Kitasatospora sp. NPDC088391]|uniref:ATP-binding protein n=1 Tax=Kitasatospora sp. NPDC088391 TaxID=3364074 RepID=UPI00380D7260
MRGDTMDRENPTAATLAVPAALGSLHQVADFVRGLADRAGLSTEAAYRLRLAADELATNIVVHGYRGAPGPIRLAGHVDGQEVRLRFEDDAPPFDPRRTALPPDLDRPLSERRIGGLGVFLALTSVDCFDYERTDGHNVCTLAVRGAGPGCLAAPTPHGATDTTTG